ncbi:Integrin-like protein [Candidatus Koribacter versatilis Ellin345]|uniref:Integrin-like protein n=1 Tax=Koribacter versatilis (strain Ellin345) TaxID=204669 RepID=Q1IJ57_KORVE|nr:VCBS repeat-containing protein [Candidatus Koribacter versatilis]ABF43093.1 Integrin-like protein [Candidatus Koribacter versatilis Ellin345]
MRIITRLLTLVCSTALTVAAGAQAANSYNGTSPITYNYTTLTTSGAQGYSVASSDFNRDGNPDLVGGTENAVDVWLATGRGTYVNSPVSYALPFSPTHIETPDLNNDGWPDIVTAIANEAGVTDGETAVLLNNGNGTFRMGTTIPKVTGQPIWVSAGDLNNDGNIDLVVEERMFNNGVQTDQFIVYMGHGNGTFTKGQVLNMSKPTSPPVLADLNGDGKLDIVNAEGTKALIWPGKGDGTFGTPMSLLPPSGAAFNDVTTGDFNNDGILDLALVWSNVCGDACGGPNNNRLYIYKNNGKAQFTLVSGTNFGGCSAAYPVAADINGDGNIDINLVGPSHFCGFSEVAFGNGKGGFSALMSGPSGDVTSDMFYRDLNLDSRHDVALSDTIGGDVVSGLATNGYTNCAPPTAANPAAKICSPTGSSWPGTFTLRASGNSPSGIVRMEVWIDGVKKYQKWNDQLGKSFTLSAGQHRITVVAVDKYKGDGRTTAIVNVQ